ncbi:MAG: STT3 domain-containing protein [archaeon]|nr:STT3 domain-containing protein [archaeon]
MENNDLVIQERKEKFIKFFKNNPSWIFYLILIGLVIFGVSIRTIPMADHGNGTPGLWDITTNDWTLGPDLDPFLFLRYAKEIVEHGSLPSEDALRSVPLGFDPTKELQMVSHMIVLTYKFLKFLGSEASINYAGVIMPVIFFGFTIIAFFFFVREIFYRKNEKETHLKANIIATISTLFMIVIPNFVSRTIAGIPEKESIAFFFMFAAFYFFLKAWKSENTKWAVIHGLFAGLFSGLMSLSWGGASYLYFPIAISCFVAFILNKFNKNRAIALAIWVFVSPLILFSFSNRYDIKGFFLGLDTGLALLTLITLAVDYFIWNSKLKNNHFLNKIKLPKHIISLIITTILGLLFIIIFLGFGFITNTLNTINQQMFNPVTGRWKTTVAENRSPYFTEWAASFGPFIKNIPVLFWMFFAGSVLLFRKMLNKIEKNKAWILTGLYILFFFGLVFSKYSETSIFNGESFVSHAFYYLSALALIIGFGYFYIKDYQANTKEFDSIEYEYLLLFILLVLCLFTARAAIRLIMVLGPIAPVFMAYLLTELCYGFRKINDKTIKTITIFAIIVLVLLGLYTFSSYYNDVKVQAYSSVPYYYTQQWQNAMSWVRDSTPVTSVFAHWWDYGYWVQSMGERATVTDGGNLVVWWNYLTGRYVMTGDNQKEALEFLYTHKTNYLLMDSSDLGKYGAFSQIGSDINYDRLSYGPITMISDLKQVQETANGTLRVYQGQTAVDEDITYKDETMDIYLPGFSIGSTGVSGYNAMILGTIIEVKPTETSTEFNQPSGIYYLNGQQIKLPLRYLYYNGQLIDYGNGVGAAVYVIPRVTAVNNQMQIDDTGAVIYISPRILRGMLGQLYLLDNAFGKFNAFQLAHNEDSIIVSSIKSQGANVDSWVYFDNYGLQGPIRIWKINYLGNEKENPEYLRTTQPASINWQF